MDMAAEDQGPVSPDAIAAALRAAAPVTTSLEKILQEGAQPMGQPPWALLNATPVPQPTHGGYSGHILPGVAFLSLGFWWLLGVVRAHAAATPQRPFVARAWYPVFLDSSSRSRPAGEERREQQQQQQRRGGGGGLLSRLFCCCSLCRHSLPLEPCLILALCLLGVNAELWLGHDSFRTLHRDDGYLFQMHLAEWQHVVMYLAFCFSALVSLAAHLTSSSSSNPSRPPPLLPRRAPHFALAGAFALEFALFAFHLEGTALDVRAHSLLVVTIGCCALFSAVEAVAPENSPVAVEVAAAKSFATWLQGCWFVALAEILFKGRRSMDPRYHGSVMFLPAILGFLALASGCLWVGAFLVGGAVLRGNGGGGGGGAVAAGLSPSRRRHRQVYGRLDDEERDDGDDDDDEDQQKMIGAVAVAPKARLGAVLELSAV